MVNVLEGNSFGSKFGAALGGGLGQGFSQGMSQAQKFAHEMQLQEAKQKKDQGLAKEQTLEALKGTINQLKAMAEADVAGIGRFGEWSQSSEALQNRGQFQTLTSDLFSFYKSLFPRGITQEEFKRLQSDYIPKAGDPTSAMVGKLNGFMDLIERKLGQEGKGDFGKDVMKEPGKSEDKSKEEFVNIRNKKTGKVHPIPKDKVEAALAAGGERA